MGKRDNDTMSSTKTSNPNTTNPTSASSSQQSNTPLKSSLTGSSSYNLGSQDEAIRRMSKLVNSLFSRSDCAPFREPVDWRGLELWDYPKIIKKMMDLGTVKRKIERGQYDNASECANDVRLIWKNCIAYNADGSDFFLLAEAFSKRFEDRYKKIGQEFDTGENGGKNSTASATSSSAGGNNSKGNVAGGSTTSSGVIEAPSLEAKTKFSGNLFRLTGVQLGHVLQVLDLRCPRALERPANNNTPSENNSNGNNLNSSSANDGDEEIEINVDLMDPKNFLELDTFVREKVLSNRRTVTGSIVPGHGSSSNQHHNTASSVGEQSVTGTALSGSVSGDSLLDAGSVAAASSDGGRKISSKKVGKRKR